MKRSFWALLLKYIGLEDQSFASSSVPREWLLMVVESKNLVDS